MSIRIATSHLNRRDATFCPAIANLRNSFEVRYDLEDTAASGIGALQGVIALQSREAVRVVLGPNGSGESQASSTFLSVYGVPQISWAATAASLSSKLVYPNFWRSVSPDSLTMRVLSRLIVWLGFSQCNVVSFDDTYTDGQRSDLMTASVDYGLSVSPFRIPNSGEGGAPVSNASRVVMMRVLASVRSSACRVNVALAINEQAWDLFQAVYSMGLMSEQGFIWLGGDGISGPQLAGLPDRVTAFNGSLFIVANSRGTMFTNFSKKWAREMPETDTPEFNQLAWCKNGTTKAVCNQMPSTVFSSWVVGKHNTQFVCNNYEALAYDAMVTLALVADRIFTKKGGVANVTLTEKDWFAEMLQLAQPANAFTCLSGLLSFNANQERDMPMNIFNWQADKGMVAPVVATWTGLTGFRWKVGQTVYWPAGSSGFTMSEANITFIPSGRPLPCPGGSAYDSRSGGCVPCPAGQFMPAVAGNALATSCLLCPGGTFADMAGQTECKQCKKGSKSSPDGLGCTLCEPGHVSTSDGLSQCDACDPGSFAEKPGSTECSFCPRGYYAVSKGTAACQPCPEGLTTENIASQTPGLCVCREGTYFSGATSGENASEGQGQCVACAVGLSCPAGLAEPTQEAGFYAEVRGSDRRLSVFRCAEAQICPAGPAGACPENRHGRACDFCQPNTYARPDGTCRDCRASSGPSLQIALVMVVVLLALALLAWLTARGRSVIPLSLRNVDGCANAVLLGVQCLSALGGLDVKWTDPVARIQGAVEVLHFSIDIVQPSCLFLVSGALSHYSISVLMVPSFIVYIIGVHYLVRIFLKRGSFNHLCNTVGRLVWMTYMPVSLLAFAPMQCGENPTGESTMLKYRSILCWEREGDHRSLLAIGCVTIAALPVPFLAISLLAAWLFPRKLVSEGGVAFLRRFDFLFHHVRGKRYYFVVAIVLRGFIFALTPAGTSNNPKVHLMVMVAVLALYQFAQSSWQPWRSPVANFLDGCITMALLLVAAVGCLLSRSDGEDRVAVATLSASLLLASLLSVVTIGFFTYQLMFPPKRFAAFLSHHKGGAAVLARLFKEAMSERVQGKVFLDSDALDDLDLLVSVVAQSTKVFISILTHGYLNRMWCAIEVVAAVTYKVKTLPVACEDFETVNSAYLDGLASVWSPGQWSEMEAHGCTLQSVRAAYETLTNLPVITLQRAGQLVDYLRSIEDVVAATGLPRKLTGSFLDATSRGRRLNQPTADILVTGRTSDAESLCACYLLQRYLQSAAVVSVATVRHPEEVIGAHKAYLLVVLLQPGLLESPQFATLLHEAGHLDMLPVTIGPFQFPTAQFYEALRTGELFPPPAADLSLLRVVQLYAALFQVLAAHFTPQGSKAVLQAEVSVLARRVAVSKGGALKWSAQYTNTVKKQCSSSREQELTVRDDVDIDFKLQIHSSCDLRPWRSSDTTTSPCDTEQ